MTAQQTRDSVVEYTVVDDRSTVTLAGKSSLHPIHGRLRPGNLSGFLRVGVRDGRIDPGAGLAAHVEMPIVELSFGISMYDRDLPKRVDAARHPLVTIDLEGAVAEGSERWRLRVVVGAHGVERAFEEAATVTELEDGLLSFRGSHRFDITEFDLRPPKVLGLKVHPEFEVSVDVVVRRVAPSNESGS